MFETYLDVEKKRGGGEGRKHCVLYTLKHFGESRIILHVYTYIPIATKL